MADPADPIRYRALAQKARKSANRTRDREIRLAYEHIADQYDQLALTVDTLLAKPSRQRP